MLIDFHLHIDIVPQHIFVAAMEKRWHKAALFSVLVVLGGLFFQSTQVLYRLTGLSPVEIQGKVDIFSERANEYCFKSPISDTDNLLIYFFYSFFENDEETEDDDRFFDDYQKNKKPSQANNNFYVLLTERQVHSIRGSLLCCHTSIARYTVKLFIVLQVFRL